MTDEQLEVRRWMLDFGQECPLKPKIPKKDIQLLRLSLHQEECVKELARAFEKESLTEIADSIADSLFVVLGTAVACGIDMESIFFAICNSNNSKFWSKEEVAAYPIDGEPLVFKPAHDAEVWVAYNREGKVIKSPSWHPPDIKGMIEHQLHQ